VSARTVVKLKDKAVSALETKLKIIDFEAEKQTVINEIGKLIFDVTSKSLTEMNKATMKPTLDSIFNNG
jgi:hypothetical protein